MTIPVQAIVSEIQSDFMLRVQILRNFLMAGPLLGATCGLLSVYVVLRRMALISEGISHAGFGGFAVAILVGYYVRMLDNLLAYEFVAGIFCVATALSIGYVTKKKRVTEDSAIGIFLVASVAFGMVLLQFRQRLPARKGVQASVQTVENLLFGGFSTVNGHDVVILAVTLGIVGSIVAALYYQFLYTTLDEEMARINGVNTRLVNLLQLVMISVVTVISIRMVGSLMITALMVIPGASANMLSRRFGYVLLASVLIGALGCFGASLLAFAPMFDNLDPGPNVVLVLFLIFGVVWGVRQFKPKRISEDARTAVEKHVPTGSFAGHSH